MDAADVPWETSVTVINTAYAALNMEWNVVRYGELTTA